MLALTLFIIPVMLGVLCARPKLWILNTISMKPRIVNTISLKPWILNPHSSSVAHQNRFVYTSVQHVQCNELSNRRRHHSNACTVGIGLTSSGGAASVWHAILPSSGGGGCECRRGRDERKPGEGSWNATWDERPARWLHRTDSAWLLFGVCSCLAPVVRWNDTNREPTVVVEHFDRKGGDFAERNENPNACYKVTGVLADGRCLFRAIAHGACLKSGEEAPDDNRERELADELRAQVVDELLKRRKETEWFIEGDFDAYVKQIQQPNVWGGEPELLMASHVLKKLISVFMREQSSGNLVNIANYGEEYWEDKESSINVLFHGYGHYDVLETFSDQGSKESKPVVVRYDL